MVTLSHTHQCRTARVQGRFVRSAFKRAQTTPRCLKEKSSMTKRTKLAPVSPGEMLLEEFLKPMELSQYRLAKEIGVSQRRIGEIVAGKRAITADTDLRLCRFFKLSDGCWLRLQADYDTALTRDSLAKTLAKIKPWSGSKHAA